MSLNKPTLRADLEVIANYIPARARVLDVGCGTGDLMETLTVHKHVDARGLEINGNDVTVALGRGLSVMQGDADTDLVDYPDGAFDYAILSQTLQTTRRPDHVLDELLRVGTEAFVSFPNFAHWRVRASLLVGGRMPVTETLPLRWYDTPNIHHLTIDDFRAFLRARGVRTEGCWFLSGGRSVSATVANLRAEHAVFLLSR